MHPSMDCSALCFEQQCTLANSRVHSYRFVHSLAWETLLTLGNTTCLSNTLSLYSSFQKRGFTKCPSFRFMQKISGNTTHCIGEHNLFFKYFLYLCCLSKACLYEISFIFINVNEYLKNIWLCVINKYWSYLSVEAKLKISSQACVTVWAGEFWLKLGERYIWA